MRLQTCLRPLICFSRCMSASKSPTTDPLFQILTALAEPTRFRIVSEILQHGPNTAVPLAAKLGAEVKQVSRHLHILKAAGVLEQWVGRVFRIPERFLVPGERAIDLGPVRVRFN